MPPLKWYNLWDRRSYVCRTLPIRRLRPGRNPIPEVSKIVNQNRLIRKRIMLEALLNKDWWFFLLSFFMLFLVSCGNRQPVVYGPKPKATDSKGVDASKSFASMGYVIQAGAFSKRHYAAGLTNTLKKEGVDAYYFIHETGLYKVRFGDFPSKESAVKSAKKLYAKGIIDVYYIVGPEDYPKANIQEHGEMYLREEIVKTAERFLGIPYQWGGSSPETGFDCSGLTTSVYELNGLKLPRSSGQQWLSGTPVTRDGLSKGDLVFFATTKKRKVTHVGIYVSGDKFIHAPGKGKTIRLGSLSNGYFKKRYVGARTYL